MKESQQDVLEAKSFDLSIIESKEKSKVDELMADSDGEEVKVELEVPEGDEKIEDSIKKTAAKHSI